MMLAYADASALVKLILDEPDARSFRRWYIEAERVATSHVGAIETARAAARKGVPIAGAERVLRSVEIVVLDQAIGHVATMLTPTSLGTLDAIHLASAMVLPRLDAFVTYDHRLAEAAVAVGLPVVRPA
jgi:uncharacterized protein